MATHIREGSSSIENPDYWWYRCRADLLRTALGGYLGMPDRLLDVGSADGPSVGWMRGRHRRVAIDVDPRGLAAGEGVCASALALPFASGTFDVVGAFDVVEHCADEGAALSELVRVLTPGGRLLVSVPAYDWAWSDHDVRAGHHRRYTKRRLETAVARAGLTVQRSTYGFCAVFPLFVTERAVRKLRQRVRGSDHDDGGLPNPSPAVDRLLSGLCRLDQRALRRRDLPFGSSVFLAATKKG